MISVSALCSYLYCPRKLYLTYVLGIYEVPKEALVMGTVRHRVYELINNAEESLVKGIIANSDLDKIKETYKQKYSILLRTSIKENKYRLANLDLKLAEVFKKIWPIVLEESITRATNVFSFSQKTNLYGQELWEKLTPKIESEFRIESKELGLKGIIDQLEKHETGFVPIELKTGKMPDEGVWPGHKIQVGAYCMLLEENYGKEIKEGFVHYLDFKKRIRIPINIFLKEEIKDLITKVKLLFKSKELPVFCSSENKCNACGLKDKCYDEKTLKKLI